jgi:hypothetical protein
MAKEEMTEEQRAKRDEIRRTARLAATKAGKDWSQLSKEERKSFRLQARKDAKGK